MIDNWQVIAQRNNHSRIRFIRCLVFGVMLLLLAACATGRSDESRSPTQSVLAEQSTISATPDMSSTPVPTGTSTPTQTTTPSLTPTQTSTMTATQSQTPTPTATETSPPPTPFGEDAIYIYGIQNQSDDPKVCDYIAVKINTGLWRTGDIATDLKTALRSLFVKRQTFGALLNPVYLSNIEIESVDFKPFYGEISIRLAGTYVRSGDPCDDGKVRAQIWSTIRQFPEIKSIDILLNGNLLGDILATGRK